MPTIFRLAGLLEARGLNQRALARLAKISYVTVNRLCRNTTAQVSLETLDRIATALAVQPGELVSRVIEKPEVEFEFKGHVIRADIPAGHGSLSGPAIPWEAVWQIEIDGDRVVGGPRPTELPPRKREAIEQLKRFLTAHPALLDPIEQPAKKGKRS